MTSLRNIFISSSSPRKPKQQFSQTQNHQREVIEISDDDEGEDVCDRSSRGRFTIGGPSRASSQRRSSLGSNSSSRPSTPRLSGPAADLWLSLSVPKFPRVAFNNRSGSDGDARRMAWSSSVCSQQKLIEVDRVSSLLLERHGSWLNDRLINSVLQCKLTDRRSVAGSEKRANVTVLSSYFFSKLVPNSNHKGGLSGGRSTPPRPAAAVKEMQHWVDEVFFERSTEGSTRGGDTSATFSVRGRVLEAFGAVGVGECSSSSVSAPSTIIIPVNDVGRAHWLLVVIHIGSAVGEPLEVVVVDSLIDYRGGGGHHQGAPTPKGFRVAATTFRQVREDASFYLKYESIVQPILTFLRSVATIHATNLNQLKQYKQDQEQQHQQHRSSLLSRRAVGSGRPSRGFEGIGFDDEFHGVSFSPTWPEAPSTGRSFASEIEEEPLHVVPPPNSQRDPTTCDSRSLRSVSGGAKAESNVIVDVSQTICGIYQLNGFDCGVHTLIAGMGAVRAAYQQRPSPTPPSTPRSSSSHEPPSLQDGVATKPWSVVFLSTLRRDYASLSGGDPATAKKGPCGDGPTAALRARVDLLKYLQGKRLGPT